MKGTGKLKIVRLNMDFSKLTRVAFLAFLTVALVALVSAVLPGSLEAKVTGLCGNCHTMHNSQNGSPMAMSGAAWDQSGTLSGTADPTPNASLLISDCVGCHSSSTSDTIVTVNGTRIPIVYNVGTAPVNPLAGGNYYWVAQGPDYDGYGHNVYGISARDHLLPDKAPGRDGQGCSDTLGCHQTLAVAPDFTNLNRGGCQGCHVFTYHHVDNAVYRFLKGHDTIGLGGLPESNKDITTHTDYVTGVEDDDWEQETAIDHNWYKGSINPYTSDGTYGLDSEHSITSFCTGCHFGFHGPLSTDKLYGMGSAGVWLRHPTDILLPDAGEYASYNPVTSYSAETPVAWINPDNPVRGEAVVMCLSCHRAHGSDQPDSLRFDYETVVANGGGTGGCLRCHSGKQ